MEYCKKCILPSTRPGLVFDTEGVCSSCRNFESRENIDWKAREQNFDTVVAQAKKSSKGYDCVIPVSGGKDSTWQTVKCLQKGLNPLCVTWRTPARTKIGQENLDNLISLGVDHIDYQINPRVEKKFILESYIKFGSTAIPMHMALFNIPLNIATRYEIPLVVWGENSAFEYGGIGEEKTGFQLNSKWLKEYGVTHGTAAEDWVSGLLSRTELTPYFGPCPDHLEEMGIKAVFLGYYYPWDVAHTFEVAKNNGFKKADYARSGIYEFADIDDDYISIHHFLKWYKFGFTRAFDNLSLEIRNGRLTREEAILRVKLVGESVPHDDINKFCKYIEITTSRFFEIAETFRNRDIWYKEGITWKLKNFLVEDWEWR